MALGYILAMMPFAYPELAKGGVFLGLTLLVYTISPFGAFWMMYQAIRYERYPGKYVLLAFVPFLFIWYWQGRFRMRQSLEKLSVSAKS